MILTTRRQLAALKSIGKLIVIFFISILLINYERSKIITKQNSKFKILSLIYKKKCFLLKSFEQFSQNQNIRNYSFYLPRFPKVSNLHSFLLMLSPNTSRTQRAEEEMNYSELKLGCIITNYKLSRILFTNFQFENKVFSALQYVFNYNLFYLSIITF